MLSGVCSSLPWPFTAEMRRRGETHGERHMLGCRVLWHRHSCLCGCPPLYYRIGPEAGPNHTGKNTCATSVAGTEDR